MTTTADAATPMLVREPVSGAPIPRWGPSAAADRVYVAWQRRRADEFAGTATDHGVIVHFAQIGRRETRLGGRARREFAAAAGSVEIVPAAADHWARWNVPKDSAHVLLSPAKLDEIARLHFDRDDVELFARRVAVADPEVLQIASLMREELRRGREPMSEFYLDTLATLLGVHLLRRHSSLADRSAVTPPRRGGLAPNVRRAVLDYMAANFDRGLTVADLARVAGLSPAYFLRAFRDELGTTPHRHLLALRVAAAERMLLGTDEGLATIAYSTGFSSQSHMTTAFAKVRGRTPGTYRERQGRHAPRATDGTNSSIPSGG